MCKMWGEKEKIRLELVLNAGEKMGIKKRERWKTKI